ICSLAISSKAFKVRQKLVSYARAGKFLRFQLPGTGDSFKSNWIGRGVTKRGHKRISGIRRGPFEDKTSLVRQNEIAKATQIRSKHGTTVRHRFERRETKSFAACGQRGIRKNSRSPELLFQGRCIEDWPSENDPVARNGRALLQLAKIIFASPALLGICRTDNDEFPIGKIAAAQTRECFNQRMHAFLGMDTPDIKDDFRTLLQRQRRFRRNNLRMRIWNRDDFIR